MDSENNDTEEQTATVPPVRVIPLMWEDVLQPNCVIVRGDDREVERMWGVIRRCEQQLQRETRDDYNSRDLALALQAEGVEIATVERPHNMFP